MESHKIIQVEEKVPLKLLLPLSIQHMFAMFGGAGSVHIRNQSSDRTFYERCGNTALYCGDKSEVTGVSRIQLCIPCTGWCRDQ